MIWITDTELNSFIRKYKLQKEIDLNEHKLDPSKKYIIDWEGCSIGVVIYDCNTKNTTQITSENFEHIYNEFAIIVNSDGIDDFTFENVYYANNIKELKEILDYILNNKDIFEFKLKKFDALTEDTIRLTLEEIDEIV